MITTVAESIRNGISPAPGREEKNGAGEWPVEQALFPEAESKANILLVDDRDDKAMAMESIIADLGENVVKAKSGREALRCLLHADFAVILLDVNMPGMDGFETAFLIRQRKSLEHVPIIFVTAISDTETHLTRGYELGAVDYILTPVMPEVLRTKVAVFVELYKKNAQLKRQADRLRQAHDELEIRVRQRTAELAVANESLKEEITERHRVEDKIQKLNGDLERRVSERTVELASANRELETFSYSVAHDLRAPLRRIHAYAQILEEDFGTVLPPEAKQYIKRISVQGQSLGKMVDDLLDLSRVTKQEFHREKIPLQPLLDEVVAAIKLEAEDRHVEWKIGPLPIMACDAILMRQVFYNLVSNAVKYTRPRDPAMIEMGQIQIKGETAFFIRDNGVGFDMSCSERLFGVFQRLHRAEDFEGTGVGLAIAARIIHKHGGRIWAESEVEKGATFFFTVNNA